MKESQSGCARADRARPPLAAGGVCARARAPPRLGGDCERRERPGGPREQGGEALDGLEEPERLARAGQRLGHGQRLAGLAGGHDRRRVLTGRRRRKPGVSACVAPRARGCPIWSLRALYGPRDRVARVSLLGRQPRAWRVASSLSRPSALARSELKRFSSASSDTPPGAASAIAAAVRRAGAAAARAGRSAPQTAAAGAAGGRGHVRLGGHGHQAARGKGAESQARPGQTAGLRRARLPGWLAPGCGCAARHFFFATFRDFGEWDLLWDL